MNRALDALTGAAFLALAVGVSDAGHPVAALVAGLVYLALATVGFGWVRGRGRRWALVYVGVQLALGYAVFVLSGATVGAVLLQLVLVSQTVLLLSLRGAAVVVCLVPFAHLGMAWRDGLREGVGMLAAAVFAAVLPYLFVREQEARVRLREYALQAERLAAAQERNRVARDIHDGLGHSLTVVQMQVKAARAVLQQDPRRADAVLEKAERQAEEALAEVRRSVGALREPRPPVPLSDALRALADEASAAGVPTSLEVSGAARPLPADAEESLYRAAQEGLTNVRKHADATRAELRLDYTRPAAVRLEIRDDGVGLDLAAGAGYGLVGVRERAAHAGGRMSIESERGRGSTLSVEVPG
ncbi:sensor histidine kinase [Dactylosporangium salmoneum]|uniref:Oxygen sensor histidine kinase NreB n=1 Tax=Dactylosporangium salmoneum TaxID=53361 RepID=A0ABN3FZJ0_9ACTN